MQHRPKYHFLPEKNWMNDPNATIFFEGTHHLFYQYNPTDWHWGNLHWGHATSKDLLHWEHQPIALTPDMENKETDCYSGCSYIHNGKIELFYTSVGKEDHCQHDGSQQWVAVTEDGVRWKQIKDNPVMKIEPEFNGGKKLTEWRDPFVFQWKGKTYALVAGIVDNKYSAVHIYTSEDMRQWTYVNEFFRNNCAKEVMECPNLVVFGDKVLFIHSYWDLRVLHYYVGTINEDCQLEVYNKGDVDCGDFFASQISFDDKGRTYLWGWLREDPRRGLYTDGEWAGVQAIPRVISINEDNELVMQRLPEFENLRGEKEAITLENFSGERIFETKSNTAEIKAVIKSDEVFTIRMLASDDGREYTDVVFNPREGTYYAPMEESSLLKEVDKRPILGYFKKSENHEVAIDILLDGSVAEIFVDDNSAMALRIYPSLEGKNMSFLSKNNVEKASIEIYEIEL